MKTVNNKLGLLVITGSMLISGTSFALGNDDHFVTSPDKVISVENWMVDNDFWNFEEGMFYFGASSEKALEIEGWMSDESYFNRPANLINSLADDHMEIEEWMMNEFYNENRDTTSVVESTLEIEEWMVNDNLWEK